MCGLKALATWILFSWKWLDLEAFFFVCFPCRQMLVASVLVRVMAAVRVKGSLIRQEGDGGVSVSSIN